MSFRWIGAARLLLATVLPVLAMQATAQTTARASGAPVSDDSVPPFTVQIAPPPISISAAMLGISSPLGAQAAAGKPMVAEFVTEHRQNFADGNRILLSTASFIYRDAQGRVRRESQLSVPGLPPGVSASSTFITIVDHQLGYGYVLNPQEMIAHRYELNGAGSSYVARLSAQSSALLGSDPKQQAGSGTGARAASATSTNSTSWHLHMFPSHRGHAAADGQAASSAVEGASAPGAVGGNGSNQFRSNASGETGNVGSTAMRFSQPFPATPNPVRTENLGEENILGFKVQGTRVITTLPAGQIGNDRPIEIVSEQWFSPELEVVMRSMHRDPWAGEFTTTVTRVSRGEQPASLFRVPSAYKVIDAAREEEHHVLDVHDSRAPSSSSW